MAVNVMCPGCRTSYPVTDDLLGKTIRCKKCQETFTAKAAKATVAAARGDGRIQKTAPAAVSRLDDDDFEPRNGKARMPAKKPAESGNNSLIVGGSIAGVTIVGLIGALVWALFIREPEKPAAPQQPTPIFSSNTPVQQPTSTNTDVAAATTDVKANNDKTVDNKPVTKPSSAETSTAQMVTSAELVGGVRKPRPAVFRREVIERAKKSAVFFYVVSEEGGSFGSGWVGEKHGNERYIITNSHVVGMKAAASPPPDKIEVTFDIGTPQQHTLEGKVVALDRDEDLAVVRVKGQDLPDPLPIAPSFDLQDTEKVVTLGFPLGHNLRDRLRAGLGVDVETTVSVREAPVTRRVFNAEDGSVKYIQIEGGVDPGNSGGAVIDTNGNVVAVVVAQAPGTNMKFVIPSEYVMHLLAGRILKVFPGQAVKSGDSIKQPIRAIVADPMKRLRSVSVDVWTGRPPEKGLKVRTASATAPQPMEGDGSRVSANLSYNPDERIRIGDAHKAEAELTLPMLKSGDVYWFQPHYVANDGKERWGEAVPMEMGRFPVDAKPALLEVKHKEDRKPDDYRRIELISKQLSSFFVEELGGGNATEQGLRASLTEKTRLVDKNGSAQVRLQYQEVHFSDPTRDASYRQMLRGVLEAAKYLGAEVTITKDGRFVSPKPDFAQVPQSARRLLGTLNSQVIQSLETLSIPLPNKELQPGDTWSIEMPYTMLLPITSSQTKTENALFRTTCRYVGTRIRNDREEAVIELTGSVIRNQNANNDSGAGGPSPGAVPSVGGSNDNSSSDESGRNKRGIFGKSVGAAVVDIATGHVTIARCVSEIAVGTQVSVKGPQNQDVPLTVIIGTDLDTTLQRGLTKDPIQPIKDLATVLPNLGKTYNPLVGVGDPLVAEPIKPIAGVRPRGAAMPADVAEQARKATVMIRSDGYQNAGEGSGWFAEPGIVVTNCHVVDMLSKSARPPKKITVWTDKGLDTEREFSGKLLAIDREDDLAVIRLEGANLPEPYKVVPSTGLEEADQLTILGFPLGSSLVRGLRLGLGGGELKTTLSVRPTTVSRRVMNSDQSVKYIQFEGGADHGNSGGPIVDAQGHVRAVLVAGIDNTQLRWGIPAEYAARVLQGWPLEVEDTYAYLDGSTARQPIKVIFADPLRRVSRAAIDVWVGAQGKPRKPSEKLPEAKRGDTIRQTFELRMEPDSTGLFMDAVGEFPLPPRSPGEVYWLQPRFVNGTGKELWGRAVSFSPDGPPLERKTVALVHKLPPAGSERTLELKSDAVFHRRALLEAQAQGNPLKATVIEKVLPLRRGQALVEMSYKDLIWNLPVQTGSARVDSEIRDLLKQFTDLIKGVKTVMRVTREGLLKSPMTDYSQVPIGGLFFTKTFNDQLMQSLVAMSIPFPQKSQVKYFDTWENPTNLFIETRNRFEPTLFTMKFQYLGVRDRGGRLEAVVEINGSLAKDPAKKSVDVKELKAGKPEDDGRSSQRGLDPISGYSDSAISGFQYTPPSGKTSTRGLYGLAKGYAYIDVNGGYVAEVKLFIDVDVEMTVKDPDTKTEIPVPAGGTMEVTFQRRDNAGSR